MEGLVVEMEEKDGVYEAAGAASAVSESPGMVVLMTRCGCVRVLGPILPGQQPPEMVDVVLVPLSTSTILTPGQDERTPDRRRFRYVGVGNETLGQLGFAFETTVFLYQEVMTFGGASLLVPTGAGGLAA